MKLLLVEQFARGELSPELREQAPDWVRSIWAEGLYPLAPPFVYDLGGRRVVGFPLLFPLLVTPFQKLFGNIGLYLLPTLALWLLWWCFIDAARRLGVGHVATAAALAVLVFASPLTLYGAIFWEHTLAVLAVFVALWSAIVVVDGGAGKVPPELLGVLSGLAVWLRPEAALLVWPIVAACLALWLARREPSVGRLAGAATATLMAFHGLNLVVYSHPLGAHAFQIIGTVPLATRWDQGLRILMTLWGSLIDSFPLVLVVLAGLPLLARAVAARRAWLLAGLVGMYLVVVPFLVPNSGGKQWGPRYLLGVIPLLALLGAVQLEAALGSRRRTVRFVFATLVLVALSFGLASNSVGGVRHLAVDYASRMAPALDRLRALVAAEQVQAVAVRRQWIAQELAAAFEEVPFFAATNGEVQGRLLKNLAHHGVDRLLLLNNPGDSPPLPSMVVEGVRGERLDVRFAPAGSFGDVSFYQGWIERRVPELGAAEEPAVAAQR